MFLLTVLEGLPLFGMAVPGHVAIILAGFLAKIGVFNVWWVIVVATLGAITGDFLGFYIGRKYGMAFINRLRPYFFVSDAYLAKAHALLDTHTGKAMVIGRFSPVTRALMPFLVGTGKTPMGTFWIFNIIGGVSWTVSSIILGYVFGAGYHAAAGYFGKGVVVAVIAGVIIIWGYRFVNMRFHIFARYELFTLALNVVALWGLAVTIQDAWSAHSFLANFDVAVNMFMAGHVTPLWAGVANWVSTIGGTAVSIGAGVLVTIILAAKKKWRSAAIMFLSIVSTAGALGFMKEFFMRARPDNALQVIANDPSFPSGHAGMAAAFCLIAGYLLVKRMKTSWVKRELMIVACAVITIVIGLSRLVLNVHWASDVLGGWALGVFMATASILFVRYASTLVVFKKNNPV